MLLRMLLTAQLTIHHYKIAHLSVDLATTMRNHAAVVNTFGALQPMVSACRLLLLGPFLAMTQQPMVKTVTQSTPLTASRSTWADLGATILVLAQRQVGGLRRAVAPDCTSPTTTWGPINISITFSAHHRSICRGAVKLCRISYLTIQPPSTAMRPHNRLSIMPTQAVQGKVIEWN